MDELAILKDFRLEDASPDGAREHARAALQDAMNRRRLPRRYAVALAFALATLLVAGAYAIVREYVIGGAAPQNVHEQIANGIERIGVGGLIPYKTTPHEVSGLTRIAAAAQTPHGRVYLLITPLRGGGQCRFDWFVRDRLPSGKPLLGGGGCEFGKPSRPREFGYGYESMTTRDGHFFTLVEGYAPRAVRVTIGNRHFRTPFGWFVALLKGPELITAYDEQRRVVGQETLKSPGGPPSRPARRKPVGPMHAVLVTKTRYTRKEIRVLVSRGAEGYRCVDLSLPAGMSESGCGQSPPPTVIAVHPNQIGSAHTNGMLFLWGEVGSRIVRLELRFDDGRVVRMPLGGHFTLYQVAHEDYAAGRRPRELIGRDATNHIIARERLPFAR